MNFLFIGNSFTFYFDVHRLFRDAAHSAGLTDVNANYVGKGGYRVKQYADPEDPYGQEMRALLSKKHYDRIIVQGQSAEPFREWDSFHDGLSDLVGILRSYQPDTPISLYSTWGYHEDFPKMQEFGMTTAEMEQALYDAYKKAGDEFGLSVTRVGLAFLRLYKETKWNPYWTDLKHPSFTGSYLSALTHLFAYFPALPEEAVELTHQPSSEAGAAIRKIAYEAAHSA